MCLTLVIILEVTGLLATLIYPPSSLPDVVTEKKPFHIPSEIALYPELEHGPPNPGSSTVNWIMESTGIQPKAWNRLFYG